MISLLMAWAVSLPAAGFALTPSGSVGLSSVQGGPAAADEKETFDQKLREFGYGAGVALSCMDKSKQKQGELRVLGIYNRVAQLFGTDRAFFFASAFGYGASASVDKARYAEFLKTFAQSPLLKGSAAPGR